MRVHVCVHVCEHYVIVGEKYIQGSHDLVLMALSEKLRSSFVLCFPIFSK